jgi:hypothetical protein
MFVVFDKKTMQVIHKNMAPANKNLSAQDIYFDFNPNTMIIGRIDGDIPINFDVNKNGEIVEWPLSKKVENGVISLKPFEKVENEKIVVKSLSEQVNEGLVQLTPFLKIENNQIVNKSFSEQVREGLLKIAPNQKIIGEGINEQIVEKTLEEKVNEGLIKLEADQKIVGDQIVKLTDREMFDEKRIDLAEYKTRRIDYYSNLSLEKRKEILPDYKIQNAALGIYDAQETASITATVEAFRNEFKRIRDAIGTAKTANAVDKVTDNFPTEIVAAVV